MSDITQTIGISCIFLSLLIQYIYANKELRKVKKQIDEWSNAKQIESAESLLPVMLYCEGKMFIISMVSALILGVMLF